MPGPKLNERPVNRPGQAGRRRTSAEWQPGTRAVAKFVRMSPYKARQVLDLIRGQDVERAQETLRLCERDAATMIGKVLTSAVANAEHNDSILGDELFVSACFADEGPTLKRWRPRARGRATRIRKRTCHITVIVSRLSEDEIADRQARQPGAADRRRRRAGSEGRRRRRAATPETVEGATLTEEEEEPEVEEAEETPEEAEAEVEEAQAADETEVEATEAIEPEAEPPEHKKDEE
jgi:large subunit ribosomal protein L22